METEFGERMILLMAFILSLMIFRRIIYDEDQHYNLMTNLIAIIDKTIYICLGLLFLDILYALEVIPKRKPAQTLTPTPNTLDT